MYISYSLWGDNKVYTYGMIENVLIAKEMYSEWIVRIHYNDTVPKKVIDWLTKQSNVEMVHHEGTDKLASNMFWRFYDLFLPDTVVIVRDADSRITQREVKFVNEWLESDKDFHIVRDADTNTCPIIGGAFGCKNNCLEYITVPSGSRNVNNPPLNFIPGLELMELYIKQIPEERDVYNVDQIFLYSYVYPFVVNKSMVHCSHNMYEPFAKKIDSVETGYMGEIITDCPRAAKIMGDDNTTFERVSAYN